MRVATFNPIRFPGGHEIAQSLRQHFIESIVAGNIVTSHCTCESRESRGCGIGKIARPVRERWHQDITTRNPARLPGSLIVTKEEKTVFDHRASDDAPKLIALENTLGGIEEVAGIEHIIPQKLEGCAMNLVRARFGNRVDNGAREASILRVKRVRHQPEFLNGVERGNDGSPVVPAFFNVSAVNQKRIGGFALPIDRNVAGVA